MKIGYFLSSEEWGPQDLVTLATKAQHAGFEGLWISDHYHPWNDEQASELVTPDMVAAEVPCGPDLDRHIEKINEYAEAGFDELYIQQIGPEQDAFFEVYGEHVLPRVR